MTSNYLRCPVHIALTNSFKVYPIIKNKKLYITYDFKNKIVKTFDKPVSEKECGKAMYKVYEYIVDKYKL